MPVIHLVRHGQANFGGDDYDVLSELGRRQARSVGAALGERCGRPARVLCGGLRRQVETAEIGAAAAGWDGPVRVDRRWAEYDHLEILRTHAADPPPTLADGVQQVLEAALTGWIGAGPDGGCAETWPAFTRRVRGALADLGDGLGGGEAAVVFTSAGTIAAVCAGLLDLSPAGFLAVNRVQANASVTTLVRGRSGTSLLTFNEHTHLLRADTPVTYR